MNKNTTNRTSQKTSEKIYSHAENGNVLFYLLLGIVVLAALSVAVSHGSRSSLNNVTKDQVKMAATEIISFGDTVSKAVTQLRLRGTDITELSFANSFLSAANYGTFNTDSNNEVFHTSGGGLTYSSPPAIALTTAGVEYHFLSDNEVEQIGTTCGAASCSDIIIALPNLTERVCIQINDLLGVVNPSDAPPTDTDLDETAFFAAGASPFGFGETIGDEDAELLGQKTGCLEDTTDSRFIYYRVILSR